MREMHHGRLWWHPLRQSLILCALLVVLPTVLLPAQTVRDDVEELQDVGVEEHLGATVPGDLVFTAEDGAKVRLGDLIDDRPVILTINYYRCPMLCGLQLNGLLEGIKGLRWRLGKELRIITVSMDPLEGPELARAKKKTYLDQYGRPGAGAGWRFLTGDGESIRRLATAVGFRYHRTANGQFAHPAVLELLSPSGKIVRYLYGVEYPAKTLKLALTEAGEGVIGSPLDRFILTCCRYDPSTHRYAPVAFNIMRAGATATLVLLGIVLGGLWLRERRRSGRPEERS